MTWTRVKRWIGNHPVAAGNLVVGLCLAWGLLLPLVAAILYQVNASSQVVYVLILVGGWLLVPLVLVASSMVMGSILGRAGMSVANLLGASKYVPLMVFAAMLVADLGIQLWEHLHFSFNAVSLFYVTSDLNLTINWLRVLIGTSLLSLFVMGLQAMGWALAAVRVRHKLRRGQWEITRPATAEVRRPQWLEIQIVERPARAVALLTGLCLLLSLLIEIGLLLQATGHVRRTSWQQVQSSIREPLTAIGMSAQFGATLLAFLCAAGNVRGRQGLRLAPLARGMLWGPPLATAAALLLCLVGVPAIGQNLWAAVRVGGFWLFVFDVATVLAGLTSVGQALGLGLAWLITAVQRHAGTWPAPPDRAAAADKPL